MKSSAHPAFNWSDKQATSAFINRLQADRHFRHQHDLFYIEGVRNFIQAAKHGYQISLIVYSDRLLTVTSARQLVRKLKRSGTASIQVSPEVFRSISTTKRASGIGAIVSMKQHKLDQTSLHSGLCWIVLDKVRSEGNLGTLIRTSDATGGAGFILLDKSVDPYSPITVRASMGSLFSQRFIYTNTQQLSLWIRQHSAMLIGTSLNAKQTFQRFDYPATPLIFLGEERKGMTDEQLTLCHHCVTIPMTGETDSLNLGVAGSLLMYEIFRNRN